MRELVIIGAGGHGKVVAETALASGAYGSVVFLDDALAASASGESPQVSGWPVAGPSSLVEAMSREAQSRGSELHCFAAVGSARVRAALHKKLEDCGCRLPVLIHPAAWVSPSARLGPGCVVMAGAVLNAECSMGPGCIINTCASVDHECRLGAFVHVAVGAHIAGQVSVGEGCWIGAGAVISNNVEIAPHCTLGAGCVAVRSLSGPGTYVGVPARLLKPAP